MKKLLYITNSLNAYSETFIVNTINALRVDSYVDIIIGTTGKDKLFENRSDVNLSIPQWIKYLIIAINKIGLHEIGYYLKYKFIRYRLEENRFDLVWIDFGDNGVNLFPVFKRLGKKVILHLHGYDASKLLFNAKYRKALGLFSRENIIIVPSRYNRKRLILSGCIQENIHVLPYAYYGSFQPFLDFRCNNGKSLLLFAGRFVQKKDPRILIHVFNEVVKVNDNVDLVMIGDGKLLNEVELMVEQFNLKQKVRLLGSLKHEDVLSWMSKATVYVQHSVTSDDGDQEGYPNSILEAQCLGLPVVSTIHAGIPEIVIDGETGYLVQEFDFEKMAERISYLLSNRELANKMGRRAQEICKTNASPERRLKKIIQLIDQ